MKKRLDILSDTDLALLAKDGDKRAFEELYDRHAVGVARTLASFAGPDRDLLDDLTQDVFFRIVDGLDSYMPTHPFSHWLYTVALNVGRNHARRASKIIPVDPAQLDGRPDDTRGGVDWSREIVQATVIRLVRRLPVPMRDVVSLRIGSGFSFAEIAELLGIPEGTARSRMHNAIGLLRQELGVSEPKREKK
ncbi:MAG: sigma-70 family RNA polymerase sigma factor [bacterium]